jgi:hypothetical protein
MDDGTATVAALDFRADLDTVRADTEELALDRRHHVAATGVAIHHNCIVNRNLGFERLYQRHPHAALQHFQQNDIVADRNRRRARL